MIEADIETVLSIVGLVLVAAACMFLLRSLLAEPRRYWNSLS